MPQEEVAPVGGGHTPLDAEFVSPMSLALADALDFRGAQAVPLVPALLFRCQEPPGPRPLVRNHWPEVLSSRGFSRHVPNHPA